MISDGIRFLVHQFSPSHDGHTLVFDETGLVCVSCVEPVEPQDGEKK